MQEDGQEIVVQQLAYTIDLTTAQGPITITDFRSMLSVRVDSYLHNTYGMLGHYTADGLVGRDGQTKLANEHDMGTCLISMWSDCV
jgi:hypothetical protein